MTHTYALLEVSESAYEEIKAKLKEAGYHHVFGDDGEIDMHGIALVNRDKDAPMTVWVNSLVSHKTQKPRIEIKVGAVRAQVPADAAMDIAKNIIEACSTSYADSFIVNFLVDRAKVPMASAIQALQDFREFRDKLASAFKGENQ